jgi:hypothetical protein
LSGIETVPTTLLRIVSGHTLNELCGNSQ